MTKEELLRSIPNLEQVFVIFSRLTHVPYVECDKETYDDEVFVYLSEINAVEKAKALTADKRPAIAIKVEKKNMLKIFSDLYAYGVNAVVFDSGEDVYTVQLNEFVRRPDFSAIPEAQRPLENPQFQLSMIYFMQEARRQQVEQPVAERCRDLEEEMVANMTRAQYLMPIKEVEMDGKKSAQLVVIKMQDGSPMAPVFTDAMEYTRFKGSNQELKVLKLDIEKLSKMVLPEEVKGFFINPTGVGVPMPKDYVTRLSQRYSWK
ncbi:MAG: SseB family protein [Lachnospiraceae bacterium]